MMRFRAILFGLLITLFSCSNNEVVKTGLDNISSYKTLFTGKNVAIITNHTAVDKSGRHITDVFAEIATIKALFGPEHGIRGEADAGAKVGDSVDPIAGVPIYSLYGKTRKPTAEMLKDVDIIVYDIQDIGARFYTYIWTMALAMEAAAELNIPFVVLDRPNPINGKDVEGPVLDKDISTFVGMYPIALRHGMTSGELATMFNEEGWLKEGKKAALTVVPVTGWKRSMWYNETTLKYIKPSPNMPTLKTATLYPGICLIEGTNYSEGRGTFMPFELVGAPWVDGQELAQEINALNIKGLQVKDTSFTPIAIKGMSMYPKHKNRVCNGVRLSVDEPEKFLAVETGIRIVNTLYNMYPDSTRFYQRHFDRLIGKKSIRDAITQGAELSKIRSIMFGQLKQFKETRVKYLLY